MLPLRLVDFGPLLSTRQLAEQAVNLTSMLCFEYPLTTVLVILSQVGGPRALAEHAPAGRAGRGPEPHAHALACSS